MISFYLLFLLALNKIFLVNAMKTFCLTQNINSPINFNCPGGNTGIVSNFMSILASDNSNIDIIILLAKDPNDKGFFFMLKEYQDAASSSSLYDETNATGFQNFIVNSITIAPFYCNEYNMTENCYNDGEMPIIYFKSDNFTIIASSIINITNVIIDGSDIVEKINTGASNLQQCIEMRERCCINGKST